MKSKLAMTRDIISNWEDAEESDGDKPLESSVEASIWHNVYKKHNTQG